MDHHELNTILYTLIILYFAGDALYSFSLLDEKNYQVTLFTHLTIIAI